MIASLGHTPSLFIDVTTTTCPESGASRHTVTAERRNPAAYSVYVGHPISGIRVGRILEMQNLITELFATLNKGTGQEVHCLFPMRTTHLAAADIGDNEYTEAKALFSDTRHFTLQNRMDAIMASDAVLVNFDLKDDAGNYRVSKGIPFDYGWAASCGRPVAVAIPENNPNDCLALARVTSRSASVQEAIISLNAILGHAPRQSTKRVVADVFDFTGAGTALSMIAALARADAEKHRDGGRAIISVIPEGREAACWHGQVAQVSDWVVDEPATAVKIVRHLVAA